MSHDPFGPVVPVELVAGPERSAAGDDSLWIAYVDSRRRESFGPESWEVTARPDGAALFETHRERASPQMRA